MNPLISSGDAKMTSARSPIMPAGTRAGAPLRGIGGYDIMRADSDKGAAMPKLKVPDAANVPLIEVGMMIYPDCQMGMVHGITDLFDVAGRFAVDPSPSWPATLAPQHHVRPSVVRAQP